MTHTEASHLLSLVRDQIDIDAKGNESASMYKLGNGECVVRLATEQRDWFLWSHDDWHDLRKQAKAQAKQQRKAEQQRARCKQEKVETSA